MRLAFVLTCLAVEGCGRIGFDRAASDDTAPADAPALPASLICAAAPVALATVTQNSDLAVRSSGGSFLALWAAPGEAVTAVVVANGVAENPPVALATGPVFGLAGIYNTVNTVLFATESANGNVLWSVPTMTTTTMISGDARTVARDPIVTDSTGSFRAWVRGDATGLVTSYLDLDGNPATERTIPTTAPVKSIAAADNSDHTHITWAQVGTAGMQDCFQADLDLVPMAPNLGGSALVSNDCKKPRIDSGPASADAIMTVWETSTGTIEARYHGSSVDLSATLSSRGRAPKLRFDGTRFWAAWIEEPSNVLRVAAIEEDLSIETVDLVGFGFVGDEAFELVRTNSIVHLVVLDDSSLTFLLTCT